MTIPRKVTELADPVALALAALGWVLADHPRGERFLSLTGMTPAALRTGLGEPAVQGAVLDFLAAHEPDLIAAADALGVEPGALIAARDTLAFMPSAPLLDRCQVDDAQAPRGLKGTR